jgi:hypothetical protein
LDALPVCLGNYSANLLKVEEKDSDKEKLAWNMKHFEHEKADDQIASPNWTSFFVGIFELVVEVTFEIFFREPSNHINFEYIRIFSEQISSISITILPQPFL